LIVSADLSIRFGLPSNLFQTFFVPTRGDCLWEFPWEIRL
jgi:hypothetical protein